MNAVQCLLRKLNAVHHDLMVKRGIVTRAVTGGSISSDAFFLKRPKIPADMEASIGVSRDLQNPNRKQKIFGFTAVIDTSVEWIFGWSCR